MLWDFGDTLVDETWMRRPLAECPEWPNAWADVMRSHADDWNVGRVGERDVFRALSARTGLTEAATVCSTDDRSAEPFLLSCGGVASLPSAGCSQEPAASSVEAPAVATACAGRPARPGPSLRHQARACGR
jgi:hypothetical protein